MTQEELKNKKREIFEMVYQWGRVGIIVDEHSPAYQDAMNEYASLALSQAMNELEGKKVKINCTIEDFGYHDKNCEGCDWNNALIAAQETLKALIPK